jgi:AraC-like DNA-binding protein
MILKYITLASAFNFLLLSLVLFLKKAPNRKANNIIGFLFLVIALYSYLVSFRYKSLIEGNYTALTHYIPIDGILLLLMAPCLYLYILTILNKPVNFKDWKLLFHLIPTIPFVVFIIYFFSLPLHLRIDWFVRDFTVGTWENNSLNLVLYTQIPIYLFVCYSVIKKQLKVADKVTVNNVQMDVSWLKTYLIMNISFILLSAPLCFYFANERANIIIGELGMNIQFIYIFAKSAFHKNIFSTEMLKKNANNEPILKMDEQLATNYLNVLQSFMTDFKPYLDRDCNIQSISDHTGISAHQLSYLINNKLNRSFPEFVNEYRIIESKRIISSTLSEKMTLESIGFECGFGSKSTFYSAFKKYSNQTPYEFRQNLNRNKIKVNA